MARLSSLVDLTETLDPLPLITWTQAAPEQSLVSWTLLPSL